jgi:hypothetical protein
MGSVCGFQVLDATILAAIGAPLMPFSGKFEASFHGVKGDKP